VLPVPRVPLVAYSRPRRSCWVVLFGDTYFAIDGGSINGERGLNEIRRYVAHVHTRNVYVRFRSFRYVSRFLSAAPFSGRISVRFIVRLDFLPRSARASRRFLMGITCEYLRIQIPYPQLPRETRGCANNPRSLKSARRARLRFLAPIPRASSIERPARIIASGDREKERERKRPVRQERIHGGRSNRPGWR